MIRSKVTVPTFDAGMQPLLRAVKELGVSETIEEIAAKTAEIVGLFDEQLDLIHNPEKGGPTEP